MAVIAFKLHNVNLLVTVGSKLISKIHTFEFVYKPKQMFVHAHLSIKRNFKLNLPQIHYVD